MPQSTDSLRVRFLHVVVLGVVTVASGHAQAAAPASSPAAASSAPPAVYSVGTAFDRSRGRLVVFGGYGRGGYHGVTWEWDGARWSRRDIASPSARNGPEMAFDAARRQVVLFGGDTRATGPLGDTWVFDGDTWRDATPPLSPLARNGHAMVYDERRQRVVLFGGWSGGEMLGDTWEWDGARWTQVATSGPAPRALMGLAYDAARGRTVLFGGTARFAPDAPSFGDTWEWDGREWTRREVAGPSARDHIAMGYDAAHRRVVMHGGGSSEDAARETWGFDGSAWRRLATSGPSRRFARLILDQDAPAMLLYGGFDAQPSNELWLLRDTTWRLVAPSTP
jgi:hypothetical protein